MTLLDGCLAAAVLMALVLNARLGWWTDATVALAMNEGASQSRDAAPHVADEPRSEAAS
jgi:hypothetical protein